MKSHGIISLFIFLIVFAGQTFAATTLDLTTTGSSGSIGTGQFYQYVIPTAGGTGLLDSFLQILSNDPVEQGYNTNYSPTEPDAQDAHTKAILLNDVPSVTIGGITYREFVLDIAENQGNDNELLSLDDLRLFVSTDDSLTDFEPSDNTFSGSSVPLIYSFGTDDWIKLDATLAPGSGGTDMIAHIPGFEGYVGGTYYVYLYSKFGAQGGVFGNSDSFEEWAVGTEGAFIPAPGAILLGAIGIGFVNSMRRRKML